MKVNINTQKTKTFKMSLQNRFFRSGTSRKSSTINKRIHISFLHLASFVLIYGVNILFLLIFRSYLFLITEMILTLLVPFSFYMAWRLADYIEGSVVVETKTVRPGESSVVIVSVTNHSFFCALRGTWLLTVGNSFYQTFDSQKLLLSIPPRGTRQFQMTVTMTNLGRILFSCEEFIISDLLGIFLIHADCSMEDSLFVLPQTGDSSGQTVPETYSGSAELAESTRKGNDHSEVSDLRPYLPGDRPRDIHWKLSARQRELMVKERVSLSGSEHILLLDLPTEKEKAEKLLTESYRQISGLLDSLYSIRLLVWNAQQFSFESYPCTCPEELRKAYCEIFQTDLPSHCTKLLSQYMKNCYPQLGSYMCVTEQDNAIQLNIYINA